MPDSTSRQGSEESGQVSRMLVARIGQKLKNGTSPAAVLTQAFAELDAANWPDWLTYARAFGAAGAPQLGVELLAGASRRWPEQLELLYWLGNLLRLAQRKPEAEAALREVLRREPGHEGAATSLAFMLRDVGRIDAATAVIIALFSEKRGIEEALRAGKFCEECRRPRLAREIYQQQLSSDPQNSRLLAAAGDVAVTLGLFDQGRAQLLAALAAGVDTEDWSGIWLPLAHSQRYADPQHGDFQLFERAWLDRGRGAATRIAAGFALGKAYGDLGDIERSVRLLAEANAMQRSQRAWSRSAWQQFVSGQLRSRIPQLRSTSAPDGTIPVFVVGLPRTGTTMAAELLGRHPQVRSRGEMNWLPFLAHELSARPMERSALQRAASIYLMQLRQDDAPARWYIDKNPHNFRYLGLIASLFPQARIIYCSRGRRDTALSIWSQLFAHKDMDYAYDFADIAVFAEGHDRLMQRWRQALELPIFELKYEDFVERPAEHLEKLGRFIGLPAHNLLDERTPVLEGISTASVWQARQPVYTGSVGRWLTHAHYLPDFIRCFPDESG